jgi:hypothetical protein
MESFLSIAQKIGRAKSDRGREEREEGNKEGRKEGRKEEKGGRQGCLGRWKEDVL